MGYGFVMYYKPEDALKAITSLHGVPLGQKSLHVSLAKQKMKRSNSTVAVTNIAISGYPSTTSVGSVIPLFANVPSNTNVYLAGIPHFYGKTELNCMMSPFGTILNSCVLIDKTSGANRGVGFVRYRNANDALKAINAMNNQVAPGGTEVMVVRLATDKLALNHYLIPASLLSHPNPLSVNLCPALAKPTSGNRPNLVAHSHSLTASPDLPSFVDPLLTVPDHAKFAKQVDVTAPVPNGNTKNGIDLFVFHLPTSVGDDDLRNLFGLYGKVQSVAIMRERRTGEHKGFGFVTMDNQVDAEQAVQGLNGYAVGGKYLKVSFKTHKCPFLALPVY